ncbi:MAG: SprT family zinc-dependent metalloprotease [Akkermansiaceae bacterium]|nr:SprT family zinc-dependent metalloprotease [Akkermansiaceae bacterium]
MVKRLAQLEFRFPAWLRATKPSPKKSPRGSRPDHFDSELTAWCQETAETLGMPELAKKVRVCWNPRMRTTAGRAWWPDRKIELNPKIRKIAEEEIWRTLKHEFAHLIAYERCGRRRSAPHGPEWRAACAEIGIPGETTTHSLPLEGRKMKRNHSYACPSCLVVTTRVRPFRRAIACYPCCRKFNDGQYHDRFRLIKKAIRNET